MAAQSAYTFAITDRYSNTVFTDATFAESATTTRWADAHGATELSPLRTPMVGDCTITVTAAQATQATISGYVYVEINGAPTAHQFSITLDSATTGTDTIRVRRGYLLGIVSTSEALVSPSFSPSISPSLSASISPSISSSVSPSASISPSLSPSLSPSISSSVSPSASLSPSISPSVSPSISPSISPSA